MKQFRAAKYNFCKIFFHPALFAFILAIFCAGCQSRTTIVTNIPEREANEVVVLLSNRGIAAEKSPAPAAAIGGQTAEQMWNISVPSHQITEALSVLNQAGLPRLKSRTLLDLFGAQGLVPSDLQDKIRYQEGLSQQLAATIRKMDGILDANVQITFPQDDEEQLQPTASVYVKHKGILDNPNSLTITKIKRLVASALPGLTLESVSVVTDRALYADIAMEPPSQMQEMEYVSIWSVIVAQESASRFRAIFYSFLIFLFLLLCICIWFVWKLFPILREKGVYSLFHPMQYDPKEFREAEEEEKSPAEEGGGGEE